MHALFHFLAQSPHPGSPTELPPLTSGIHQGMAVAGIVTETGLQLL